MPKQRLDLDVERVGDVHPRVGLHGARQVDSGDAAMDRSGVGEVVRVAGRWSNCVECRPTRRSMVVVVVVAVAEEDGGGIGAHDHVGLHLADHRDDVAAELRGVLEVTVVVVEAAVPGQTEHLCGRRHLLLADGRQLVGVLVGVGRALLSAGADEDVHLRTLLGPAGEGAAAGDFRVVRMGVHAEHARGNRVDELGHGPGLYPRVADIT